MSNITDYILSKTNRIKRKPEISPGDHGFEMFNDAGTEVEVSELLYGLVRVIKPNLVLETGTHIGVSAVYMAQAMKDNGKGTMDTFEIIDQHFHRSQMMFEEVGVKDLIRSHKQPSLNFNAGDSMFDLLFLDSEPQLRFDEFVKFWPNLRDGGYIIIHDLNDQLGHTDQTHHGTYDWPWGDFREKLGPYIASGEVNTISFDNPRGLTMFQKTRPTASYYKYGR